MSSYTIIYYYLVTLGLQKINKYIHIYVFYLKSLFV